jgi:biopolymer transport protein ExbB
MTELIARLFERGGPVMVPILALSLASWALIFFCLFSLPARRRELRASLKDFALEPQRSAQPEASLTRPSPITDTLRHILKTTLPGKNIRQTLSAGLELERKRLSFGLSLLATMATLAPLLGLLGTVTGMIGCFNTMSSHGTGDPALLGSGISQALITTEAGLAVAIPVLLMHTYITHKVDSIVSELEEKAAEIVSSLRSPG